VKRFVILGWSVFIGSSVLLGLLMVPAFLLAATPTISGVTGTISQGSTLTVSGTGLESENVANWSSEYASGGVPTNKGTFGGTSLSASGWGANYQGGISQVSSVFLSGSQSADAYVAGAQSGSEDTINAAIYDYGNSMNPTGYWRWYARWHDSGDGTWPSQYMKFWGVWSNNLFLVQWDTQDLSGGMPYNLWIPFPNNTEVNVGALQYDRWYCFEVLVNSTTETVWLDGKQIYTVSGSFDFSNLNAVEFGCINYDGTDAGFAKHIYLDNIAFSSSRVYPSSKIELSNNATYGAGTLVYQAPVFISDTSVQFAANLTGLGSGPYYLFVTNNGQTTSSAYTLGSGSSGSSSSGSSSSGSSSSGSVTLPAPTDLHLQ